MVERNRAHGFTLIEMVIVIAVIAVLAAVSIWPLLRAKDSTRESAALQVLRSLCSAEVQMKTKTGTYASLAALVQAGSSPVGQGRADKASDYTFSSTADSEHFTIIAIPPKSDMITYTLVESGTITPEP